MVQKVQEEEEKRILQEVRRLPHIKLGQRKLVHRKERGKSFTQQSDDMNKNVSSIQISSKARRVKKNEPINK